MRVVLALTSLIPALALGCGSSGSGGGSPQGGSSTVGGSTSGGTGGTGVGGDSMGGGTTSGGRGAAGDGTGGTTHAMPELPVAADPWQPSADCVARANAKLAEMDAASKAGQMVQANSDVPGGFMEPPTKLPPSDISTHNYGSVLSGGGADPESGNSISAWTAFAQSYTAQRATPDIPILYGVDAVHGHNNVSGAVIFPHNIGLGATRNYELVREIGIITAKEVRGTGINWTFAPVVAAALDERWGRTYEAFGEDPDLAAWLGQASVEGLQGNSLRDPESVLACAKHFAGDGATTGGENEGNAEMTEEEFRAIAVDQYQPAINSGVGSIMVSFSSFDGDKMSGHTHWLTDVLKGDPANGGLGFAGFLISDWAALQQLPGGNGVPGSGPTAAQVAAAVNAGMDMIMEPYDAPSVVGILEDAQADESIPPSRIDDAVRRILTVKCEMGLLDEGYSAAPDAALTSQIGSAAHRDVARQAVRESLVVLQNDNDILPLTRASRVHVTGRSRNSLSNQCGGWTIDWQGLGQANGGTTTGTTILQGIETLVTDAGGTVTEDATGASIPDDTDVVIVVVGETPYAETEGDTNDLSLSASDIASVENAGNSGAAVVVVVVSGRPLIITEQLDSADAWVAAWLPGTEGDGVAEVLFGDYAPTGTLSFTWPASMDQLPINLDDEDYSTDPPLFPYGHGLSW